MQVTLIQEDNVKTFPAGNYIAEAYWRGGNIALVQDDGIGTTYISVNVERFNVPDQTILETDEQINNIKLSINRLKASNKICLILSVLTDNSEKGVAFVDGEGAITFDNYSSYVDENCIGQANYVLLNPASWNADWGELDMLARTYFDMNSSITNEPVADTLSLIFGNSRQKLTINKIKGTTNVSNSALWPKVAYVDESIAASERQEMLDRTTTLHNDIVETNKDVDDLTEKVNQMVGITQSLYVAR